jgi:DNA topoisomerase-1
MIVSKLLVEHFSTYVDYNFTAQLEEKLDKIANDKMQWKPFLRDFWKNFSPLVAKKEKDISRNDILTEETDETCPECGKPLVIRLGKFGKFIACSGFPDCRYRRALEEKTTEAPEATDQVCEKCGKPMIIKSGRFGKFLACSGFPECKNTKSLKQQEGTGVPCPECHKGELVQRRGRRGKSFYSCNRYPKCKFAVWNRPINEPCPECHSPYLIIKKTKAGIFKCCPDKTCGYKTPFVEGTSERP